MHSVKGIWGKKFIAMLLVLLALTAMLALPVAAAGEEASGEAAVLAAETTDAAGSEEGNTLGWKAIATGIAIGLAAAGGAVAMGIATGKSVEGISRQPEAEGKIRTSLMLGLVFIETAIIYSLLVVILIVFVL